MSDTDTKLQDRLKWAVSIAEKARDVTLPAFNRSPTSINKNTADLHYDPVTKTDVATEKLVRQLITQKFPDDGISGEEISDVAGSSGWSWSIDPIDGTRAFLAGVPVWSLLLAILKDGEPVAGLMDFPALDRLYVGDGQKSWVSADGERRRIDVRNCKTINGAIISCTEPMAMFTQGQKAAYEMIRRTAKFSRLGLDALGYALVAEGKIDLVLEADLQSYDIQAIMPVIKGAGGHITDWDGASAKAGGAIVCAGDRALLNQVYPYLARAMD